MPLKSGGDVENKYLRGRVNTGLISIGAVSLIAEVQAFNSTGYGPIGNVAQRRCFYYDGWYYLFHTDTDGNQSYKVSSDKKTWSKPASGNPAVPAAYLTNDSRGMDIIQEGDTLYVVACTNNQCVIPGTQHAYVRIMSGTMSGGLITWGSWTTITDYTFTCFGTWTSGGAISLCKASDGYFWILMKVFWQNSIGRTFYYRSMNPNDITSWDGPYDKEPTGRLPWWCQNVPLNSIDGVYAMDISAAGLVSGRYERTDWTIGAEQTVATNVMSEEICAITDSSGVIHIAYVKSIGPPYDLAYKNRTAGVDGVWGSEEILDSGVNSCALALHGTSVYLIYRKGSAIYYRIRDGGSWGDAHLLSDNQPSWTGWISFIHTITDPTVDFFAEWAVDLGAPNDKVIRAIVK